MCLAYAGEHSAKRTMFIYLFNVHWYNTRENNITKGNSMPLTGDKSTMVASMQVTLPIPD